MAKKYLIISMGRKEVMQDGKNEAGAISTDGEYPEGYLPVTGNWSPVSLGVELYDSRKQMEDWLASPLGQAWKAGVAQAIKVQLEVAEPPQAGAKPA